MKCPKKGRELNNLNCAKTTDIGGPDLRLLCLVLLAVSLLAGCREAPDRNLRPTPANINAPRPAFLQLVAPRPQAILSLDDFRAGEHYVPIGPDHSSGGRSSICAEVKPWPLLEPGDFFELYPEEGSFFPDRVTLYVDGVQASRHEGVITVLGSRTVRNESNEIIAEAPGPIVMCWAAESLGAGPHIATIEIRRTSGTLVDYSWSFELVRGPTPTPTPLPTPAEANREGDLPPFIKGVFPAPGEHITGKMSSMEWNNELEERGFRPFNPTNVPVCVSWLLDKLREQGSLPDDWAELDEYLFFRIDDTFIAQVSGRPMPGEVAGSTFGGMETAINCADLDLAVGDHTATIYVTPVGNTLIAYSWMFTISED